MIGRSDFEEVPVGIQFQHLDRSPFEIGGYGQLAAQGNRAE